MLKILRTSVLYLCLVLSAAHATVPVMEASTMSKPGYVVFYTGACAERIGMKIARTGYQRGEDALPGLLQHAQESVKHLLALCPKADTIQVDARADGSQPAQYFSMRRANGWKPEGLISNGELKDLLVGSGYRAIAGPRPIFSPAYLRFDEDGLDIVYGNDLENRVVATHIERRSFTGQSPDEFLIKGQIYDLGFNESERKCETSRENYSLWGSFTMTVSENNQSLPLAINWCAEPGAPGQMENTEFFDIPHYGPASSKPPATAALLSETFSKSNSVLTDATAGNFLETREAIISTENYRVYPNRPDLCSHMEFDAYYRVSSEQRDRVFNGDYVAAIGNLVGTHAGRRCTGQSRFTVNAYSTGSPERWDQIRFRYNQGQNEKLVRVDQHVKSDAAKQSARGTLANLSGAGCNGPFCSLPGGRYLNAIYRGDLKTVRQIDYQHQQAVNAFLAERKGILGGGVLENMFDTVFDTDQIQMLRNVANKYMYTYPVWGEDCLDPGAMAREYKHVTPVVVTTDEYGYTSTSGGLEFEATYTLNPEFFALRDELATYRGAKRSDDASNLEVQGAVYAGIVELARTGNCRSPEVKQFEQQLRALTMQVIAEPGALASDPAEKIKQPPLSFTAPFPQAASAASRPVAWNPPVALPAFDSTIAKRSNAARPMTAQERMQKMNAEMKASQDRLGERMTALQSEMRNSQQNGASAADMQRQMQETQQKMMQLQQEFQAEMLEIQRKYQ